LNDILGGTPGVGGEFAGKKSTPNRAEEGGGGRPTQKKTTDQKANSIIPGSQRGNAQPNWTHRTNKQTDGGKKKKEGGLDTGPGKIRLVRRKVKKRPTEGVRRNDEKRKKRGKKNVDQTFGPGTMAKKGGVKGE